MAQVQVVQSNARVAAPVECRVVHTSNGDTTLARVLVISHHVRRRADPTSVEKTIVRWTVWGRLAETVSRVLVTGSHVNVSGLLRNVEYQDGQGVKV